MSIGHFILWGLSGVLLYNWRFWMPDPPPPLRLGRFVAALLAGIIGGDIGGYLVHSTMQSASSDPMPGIVAALSAGLVFSNIAASLGVTVGRDVRRAAAGQ